MRPFSWQLRLIVTWPHLPKDQTQTLTTALKGFQWVEHWEIRNRRWSVTVFVFLCSHFQCLCRFRSNNMSDINSCPSMILWFYDSALPYQFSPRFFHALLNRRKELCCGNLVVGIINSSTDETCGFLLNLGAIRRLVGSPREVNLSFASMAFPSVPFERSRLVWCGARICQRISCSTMSF